MYLTFGSVARGQDLNFNFKGEKESDILGDAFKLHVFIGKKKI